MRTAPSGKTTTGRAAHRRRATSLSLPLTFRLPLTIPPRRTGSQ